MDQVKVYGLRRVTQRSNSFEIEGANDCERVLYEWRQVEVAGRGPPADASAG
jgi:hypothetical protein